MDSDIDNTKLLYYYHRNIIFIYDTLTKKVSCIVNNDHNKVISKYADDAIYIENRTIAEILRGVIKDLKPISGLSGVDKLSILSYLDQHQINDQGDLVICEEDRLVIIFSFL